MKNNYSDLSNALSSKKDELEKLANSADGQKVKSMMDPGGRIQSAYEQGDMETVRRAVTDIMKTEEGARLAKQLSDLLK
ncbi:MAG: hypothetical protein AB7C97_09245 [Oscillospiraceae bacterium]